MHRAGEVRFEVLEPKSQILQSRWKINVDITLEKEAQRSETLASFVSILTRSGAVLLREPGRVPNLLFCVHLSAGTRRPAEECQERGYREHEADPAGLFVLWPE